MRPGKARGNVQMVTIFLKRIRSPEGPGAPSAVKPVAESRRLNAEISLMSYRNVPDAIDQVVPRSLLPSDDKARRYSPLPLIEYRLLTTLHQQTVKAERVC